MHSDNDGADDSDDNDDVNAGFIVEDVRVNFDYGDDDDDDDSEDESDEYGEDLLPSNHKLGKKIRKIINVLMGSVTIAKSSLVT